ncbi:MAG: DUF1653 domain-containing protein [Candidatus Altimarinota bacterium]
MDIKVGSKYRHYKGQEYLIIGLARHSDTLEEFVVYQGLYDSQEFGQQPLWIRPKNIFEETVEINGEKIPRFTHIK